MATKLKESRYTPEERAKIVSTLVMDGEQLAAVTGTFAGRSSPGMSWVSLLHAQRQQFQTVVVENNLAHGELTVRISDDGHGTMNASMGTGRGIVGMRERAGIYGGTVDAGPAPQGGWLVQAILHPSDGAP